MELWELYLLTRLDAFSELFEGIAFFSGLVMVGIGVILHIETTLEPPSGHKQQQTVASLKKFAKYSAAIFLAAATFAVLVPKQRDAMIILGGYYATNIEGVQDLPPNVVKAANKFIETYLGEQPEDEGE